MNGLSFTEMPRWAVMWALAFAIYSGLKLLSWIGRPRGVAPVWKHAAYLLAWPGMDANAFLLTPPGEVDPPTRREWISAWVKTCVGVLFVVLSVLSLIHI